MEGAASGRTSRTATPIGHLSGGWPVLLSRFIGRTRELTELEELFERSRLVALIGPGGVGKTRLALELGVRVRPRLRDGVFFADLAPIGDAGLVEATIAAAFGIREDPGQPLSETLVQRIGRRRALLILDGLERVPQIATVATRILARCPNLHLLATSRAPLRIGGEDEYPLAPLALPDPDDMRSLERMERTEAVALFVDRARSIDPHFALTAGGAEAIAAICRRLDGLPLAIELAAARTRVFAPAALLGRLEQRLPMLTSGPASAPPRHRTLRATMDWSYELLTATEQEVMGRLVVFADGWSLEAAEAVVPSAKDSPPIDVLTSIERLVDQSLVTVSRGADGEPRFAMLDTIREFAGEQSTLTDDLRDRHLSYFVRLAGTADAGLNGPDRVVWARRLDDDHDDLRTAFGYARDRGDASSMLRIAAALRTFYMRTGEVSEGRLWLDQALAMADVAAPILRARALDAAGWLDVFAGYPVRAEPLLEEALSLFESLGDEAGMASALVGLAAVTDERGDEERAIELGETARSLADHAGDARTRLQVLLTLATVRMHHAGPVRTRFEEAADVARSHGDDHALSVIHGRLGWIALADGDVPGAVAEFSHATDRFRRLEERTWLAWAILGLAVARLRGGEIESSRDLIREAARIAGYAGTVQERIGVVEATADWLGAAGWHVEAVTNWAAADRAWAERHLLAPSDGAELFARSLERERSSLAASEFDAAWSAGTALTLEEAMESALQRLDDVDPSTVVRPSGVARRGRHDLSPRELEVLTLLVEGRSDGEIAAALFISKKTASVHVANIKSKLGAGTRVEIVTLALRQGLASMPSANG